MTTDNARFEPLEQRVLLSANFVPGDTNGNSVVNGQDIYGFIQALGGNAASYPAADVNRDFAVNGQDIYPFLVALGDRTPAPTPSWTPTVPAGEKPLLATYREVAAGARFGRWQMAGVIEHYATSESVGDGSSMRVVAPPGSTVGYLYSYDNLQMTSSDYTTYKGLSFWVKGDGSTASGVICRGYGGTGTKFRFSLSDTSWHKIFVPWASLGMSGQIDALDISIERTNSTGTNWFLIDRIDMYSSTVTEAITPTANVDPAGDVIANQFVSSNDSLERTITKLQNKEPVKIVIAGDSIVRGAQLQHVAWDVPTMLQYSVTSYLTTMLQQAYGYSSASWTVRGPNPTTWQDLRPRGSGDLMVVGIALGGMDAAWGYTNRDKILAENPDLVIWEFGSNDAIFQAPGRWTTYTSSMIAELQAYGIDMILQTSAPSCSNVVPNANGAMTGDIDVIKSHNANYIRPLAAQEGIALADVEKAFISRGVPALGDLYSDEFHLTNVGHNYLARVYAALLTDKTYKLWDSGPDSMSWTAAAPSAPAAPIAESVEVPSDSDSAGAFAAGDALVNVLDAQSVSPAPAAGDLQIQRLTYRSTADSSDAAQAEEPFTLDVLSGSLL